MTESSNPRIWTIAVATSDGIHIDSHLGQTKRFAIFAVSEQGGIAQIGDRFPTDGAFDPHQTESFSSLFFGVDVVLAAQAGAQAIRALASVGIRAFAISGPIERALKRFAQRGKLVDRWLPPLSEMGKESSGGCGSGGCSQGHEPATVREPRDCGSKCH